AVVTDAVKFLPLHPNVVRPVALRFVKEPPDIIGDSFDQPSGKPPAGLTAVAAPAIELNDMDLFVQQRANRFAFEFPPQPGCIRRHSSPAGGSHAPAGPDRHAEA